MPYPDSEYPSILRGKDKRESQRLLAAAPELLAVVRMAVDYADDTRERFIDHWDGDDAESYNNLMYAAEAAIAKAGGSERVTSRWIVPVCRTGYAVRNIEVDADSATHAIELAMEAAGGLEFSDHSSEYKADFAHRKDEGRSDEATPD